MIFDDTYRHNARIFESVPSPNVVHSIDIRAFVYWYVALIDIEVLSFRVLGRGICEMRDDWPSLVETYARTCSLFKPKAVVGTHRLRNTFGFSNNT